MKLFDTLQNRIEEENRKDETLHREECDSLRGRLERKGIDTDRLLQRLSGFQIAVPSWALGTGGTRFGRFPIGGEPRSLPEKLEDVGILNALGRSSDSISLHIPWDVPDDPEEIRTLAGRLGLRFDAVNSNTFQDQKGSKYSYKFGSLCHTDPGVRRQAIEHNLEVIRQGESLGSKALTVWLADGSGFPGQQNFRKALSRTRESLEQIRDGMPDGWRMLVEYKPFEPHFYSMVIPDWGTSCLLAKHLGPSVFTLVDLGHHLPNTNIEQIVATLMLEGKLGGFHFNDSGYGDDDLTAGSLRPYRLFLLFLELLESPGIFGGGSEEPAWMIDASHNLKDPLEDLLQSLEAIRTAAAKAMLVDRERLEELREGNDPVLSQELVQDAFRTDVRPLLREARRSAGGALDPIRLYRELEIRKSLIEERGIGSLATGL